MHGGSSEGKCDFEETLVDYVKRLGAPHEDLRVFDFSEAKVVLVTRSDLLSVMCFVLCQVPSAYLPLLSYFTFLFHLCWIVSLCRMRIRPLLGLFLDISIDCIFSVPGYHTGAALSQYGHMKVRRELQKERLSTAFRYAPLLCQYSSMGSLNLNYLQNEFARRFASAIQEREREREREIVLCDQSYYRPRRIFES
jgi:hypothetical protein